MRHFIQRGATEMTAWWPGYSFPWIRGQKCRANENHSIWVFVLKTMAHSACCGMEAREILSGVRSLPKEAASVCTEYVTPLSRGDSTWDCSEVHWNQWEPVCVHAFIGQTYHLSEVHRRVYLKKFTGEEKDEELVLRLRWKACPSPGCWVRGGMTCSVLCRKHASWGSEK